MEGRFSYWARRLEASEVDGIVGLKLDGPAVQGGEECFCEGQFGHLVGMIAVCEMSPVVRGHGGMEQLGTRNGALVGVARGPRASLGGTNAPRFEIGMGVTAARSRKILETSFRSSLLDATWINSFLCPCFAGSGLELEPFSSSQHRAHRKRPLDKSILTCIRDDSCYVQGTCPRLKATRNNSETHRYAREGSPT